MKTKPIPVRLDPKTCARLDSAAEAIGGNRSTIVRLAILNQLPDIEAGRITLKRRTS